MQPARIRGPSPRRRWRAIILTAGIALSSPLATALAGPPGDAADQTDNQIRLNPPGGADGRPSFPSSSGGTIADISPQEAERVFEDAGFVSVRLVEDAKGDYLRLSLGGRDSFVFLMNCTNGRCRSLMFTAFLNARRGASLAFVNAYNLKTLHKKMARNAAGEIVLTMATSLTGGVTEQHLRARSFLGPGLPRCAGLEVKMPNARSSENTA